MPSLLDLASETRCLIYQHLFYQPTGELLALSREPEHDYDTGPPSTWIADSRESGLVYGSQTARATATNCRFLRTCKLIYEEAVDVFYGANKIKLYAEDNNEIFYWLLDVGERNRRAIRHLEIGWAYGVAIESGRSNIHGILQSITEMGHSSETEIGAHRQQLIDHVQRLEETTVRLIIRTLHFIATNQNLVSLTVWLPGVDGADIWDLPNPNLYFEQELFSNSTTNVHACIPEALASMVGIEELTIGYTRDIELAENIAMATEAKKLVIRTHPEAHTLNLNQEEQYHWLERGWKLGAATAQKTFLAKDRQRDEAQREGKTRRQRVLARKQRGVMRGYSEGGRLKASMFTDEPEDQ